MTAIVGIEHSGRVYLAGDRAISGDDALTLCPHPKVWRRSGIVFGAAGQLDQLQRIRFSLRVPRFRHADPVEYVGRRLVPALVALFADEKDRDLGLLVGVGGSLFYMDGGFSFCRVGPDWAIGSGGDAARAALHLLPRTLEPQQRGVRALRVAARVCLSVSGPFDVVS